MGIFRKKKSDESENGNGGVGVEVAADADAEVKPVDSESEGGGDGSEQAADAEPLVKADEPTEAPAAGPEETKAEKKARKKDDRKAARAVKRDARKAVSFFRHAETVAETRNYNYAIECYINGLRHDPDNMIKHEALREIALRRKVSGEGPAKLRERILRGGRDKVDKMLHAEMLWSKDPLHLGRALELMEKAAEADEDEPDLNLGELVHWVGVMVLEKGESQKAPSKAEILKVRDLFSRVGAWQEAVNATRVLIQADPDDLDLPEELKDLEAELAMKKGGYDADARDAVRDLALQETLDAEDRISKSEAESEKIIARRREELAEEPEDVDRKLKLIRALAEPDVDESENEAIAMLEEVLEETGLYRHKTAIGDIKMKQMNRHLRLARDASRAAPDDDQLTERYKKLTKRRLALEMSEFTERVENYPTDMKWRYELGRRQFMIKQHDESIENFQRAKVDPKYRPASHCYLGRCYIIQEWFDEAIETLRSGLEGMVDKETPLALETQWYLCAALVQSALENKSVDLAKEAQKVASHILQTNVNYRDIKDRLDQIRALVKKLQQGQQQQSQQQQSDK